MKWIGILLVAAAINLFGWQRARRYRGRVHFWHSMNAIVREFEPAIRFETQRPDVIWTRLLQKPAFVLWKGENGQDPFAVQFEKAAARQMESLALPADQRQAVVDFADGLGTTDLEGQLAHCEAYANRFLQMEHAAEQEARTKGKLACCLAATASVAVAIVLL